MQKDSHINMDINQETTMHVHIMTWSSTIMNGFAKLAMYTLCSISKNIISKITNGIKHATPSNLLVLAAVITQITGDGWNFMTSEMIFWVGKVAREWMRYIVERMGW